MTLGANETNECALSPNQCHRSGSQGACGVSQSVMLREWFMQSDGECMSVCARGDGTSDCVIYAI